MLLLGSPIVEQMRQETAGFLQQYGLQGKSMSIFLVSDDQASHAYVRLKQRYAKTLGLDAEIIYNPTCTTDELLALIDQKNTDPDCLGMIVQLPLAPQLKDDQARLLSAVAPQKDLDGLNGVELGKHLVGTSTFLPATPKAVLSILDYYGFGELKGKTVLIVGQSNLIGKPLAAICMSRGATVVSCNASSDQALLSTAFTAADIVVSATGVIHLWTETTCGNPAGLASKVLIDVGRGKKDGKPAGDIDWEYCAKHGATITPVPGGVGPVTVASLFHNLIDLYATI